MTHREVDIKAFEDKINKPNYTKRETLKLTHAAAIDSTHK